MLVAGLDVWKRGWVAVVVRDGSVESVSAHTSLEAFVSAGDELDVMGIDIPLLLPTQPPRRADAGARAIVGPRRSSVFSAPPLDVIEQPTYAEARERSNKNYGVGISAQSYGLRTRILEARAIALTDERFVEVHPEVSFAAMANGHLPFAKKTWNGQAQRRELLAAQGYMLPQRLNRDAGSVPVDDVLDAAAAAWSAARKANDQAVSLPADPMNDEGVIWF